MIGSKSFLFSLYRMCVICTAMYCLLFFVDCMEAFGEVASTVGNKSKFNSMKSLLLLRTEKMVEMVKA